MVDTVRLVAAQKGVYLHVILLHLFSLGRVSNTLRALVWHLCCFLEYIKNRVHTTTAILFPSADMFTRTTVRLVF